MNRIQSQWWNHGKMVKLRDLSHEELSVSEVLTWPFLLSPSTVSDFSFRKEIKLIGLLALLIEKQFQDVKHQQLLLSQLNTIHVFHYSVPPYSHTLKEQEENKSQGQNFSTDSVRPTAFTDPYPNRVLIAAFV